MRKLLMLLFLLLSALSYAYDTRVVIDEMMINRLLSTVGEVEGKSSVKFFNQKIKYKWKVKSANIEIKNDFIELVSDVQIDSGFDKSKAKLIADVDVKYDDVEGKLKLHVNKAKLSEVKLLKGKAKVKNVDISKFYNPNYEMLVSKPKEEIVELKLNKDKVKKIKISIDKTELNLIENGIAIDFYLKYENLN